MHRAYHWHYLTTHRSGRICRSSFVWFNFRWTRVVRLTPATHSPSLLPTFEDAQNTQRRPLSCHFWQVIYLAWVTTAAFELSRHCSGADHRLITGYQQTVIGYEENRVSHPFYSAPQCSHCKRCTSYSNSVRPSVCLSVTHRYCVKMTERRMMQFALSDSTRSPAIAEGPRDAGVPVEIW